MPDRDTPIKSFDYIRRGKEGTEYYGVRVVRKDTNRLTPLGYIVRLRPNMDDWAGFVRIAGQEPKIFRGKSPDAVKKAIENFFLK